MDVTGGMEERGMVHDSSTVLQVTDSKPLIDNFNLLEDVLFEILHRLPIKSLISFKVVSKRWFALISNPFFIRYCISRINISSSPPLPYCTILFQYDTDSLGLGRGRNYITHPAHMKVHSTSKQPVFKSRGFSLNFLQSEPQKPVKILASSNGLVLCRAPCEIIYYVANPLTMQWVTLPQPPRSHRFARIGFVSDPSPEEGTTRYRVVRVIETIGWSAFLNLEIFSSETGEWKDLKVSCPDHIIMFVALDRAVCYNGILHWMDCLKRIVAYDPNNNTDRCRLIELPNDRKNGRCLGVSNGRLRYLNSSDPNGIRSLGIWVLNDYDRGEWCLEHMTNLSEMVTHDAFLIASLSCTTSFPEPLAFHPLDWDTVYLGFRGRLASYNIQSRILEVVCYFIPHETNISWWMVHPFVLPPWPIPIPPLI